MRMVSEALELRMESGRVSFIWCMCVVCHGYGGLGWAGMEVVDGMRAGQSLGVCCVMPELFPSAR